jgi:hypothetical protein
MHLSLAWCSMNRRFPRPWHPHKIPGGYVVRDAGGNAVVYIYGQETSVEAGGMGRPMTLEEARTMAFDIAKLPDPMKSSKWLELVSGLIPRRPPPRQQEQASSP